MSKEAILTEHAPAAIGPYSQAIRAGRLLFISGQIPIDPQTGALVPGDARQQTERVLANLEAILVAAGASFGDVVKTTIYLRNLADFATVNEVYGSRFSSCPPARATVEVSKLPLGARVEIDAIAQLP